MEENRPGEETFYDGHPSWRSIFSFYFRGLLAALVVGVIVGVVTRVAGNSVNVALVVVAVLIVMVADVVIGLVMRIATRYKITSQRIVIEYGVFSKRMEQLDLYRVVDYVVERPFGQRIMGTGNLVLEAMDKTTPEIRITGIKTDVMALYEKLRYSTEQEKKKRNVRVLDIEPTA